MKKTPSLPASSMIKLKEQQDTGRDEKPVGSCRLVKGTCELELSEELEPGCDDGRWGPEGPRWSSSKCKGRVETRPVHSGKRKARVTGRDGPTGGQWGEIKMATHPVTASR